MLADPMPFIPRGPEYQGLRAIWEKYGIRSSRHVAMARRHEAPSAGIDVLPTESAPPEGSQVPSCGGHDVAKRHTGGES